MFGAATNAFQRSARSSSAARVASLQVSGQVEIDDATSSNSVVVPREPVIVYGTAWKKERTARLVEEAVTAGFRAIDTACQPKHYHEAGVGEGWTAAAAKIPLTRNDLYIQTKFTAVKGQDPNDIPYDPTASLEDQVRQSVAKSLENLRTTYLDALVLHSPLRKFDETLRVWRTMESFVKNGTVLSLGVSNCYEPRLFRQLYDAAESKPAVLQNRFHARTGFDHDLRAFCNDHNVTYQSFWTLTANRKALRRADVKRLAKSKGLAPETLMYAYVMSRGHVPLSGTTNAGHMAEDVAVAERARTEGTSLLTEEDARTMERALGM